MRLSSSTGTRRLGLGAVALTVFASVAIVASGFNGTASASVVRKSGPWRIALLAQGPTNGWATQFDAVARAVAKNDKQDISQLIYYDSHANADKQVNDMADALVQHPDIIVLVPMGKAALSGPVNRAEGRGIPVVTCASGVTTNTYNALVTHDLARAGTQLGVWMANKLHHKGNIAILDGIAGNDTSETLGSAIRGVLKKNPNIKVVAQAYTSFSVSNAKQSTDTWISSGKKIDAIWGSGGEAITGAMQAYADSGKKIPLMAGGTAQNGALRLAAQHHIQYGGWQFPAAISKACIDVALQILKGRQLHHTFIDISQVLPADLTRNFYTRDLKHYYSPKYSDDYVYGSDKYLSKADLKAMNLLKH